MITYNDAIIKADQEILVNNAYSNARYLMLELCKLNNIDLYVNINSEVDKKIYQEFLAGVERLIVSEPVDHILGYTYFYGYKFKVNNDVLIPRVETELLVMNSLLEIEEHFENFNLRVLDLACGSGAIGITLKLEEANLDVSLSDISLKALDVVRENAKNLKVDVNCYYDDMLNLAIENNLKYDVIICNPPYIENDEALESSVIDYEPSLALFGGVDGLDFYKRVLEDSKKVLNKKALIGFEIGYNQKTALLNLIKQYYPNSEVKTFKDYANLDRMIFILI